MIDGQELRIPTVKARLIYRDSNGREILDMSNVAWIPGPGSAYATLGANTPKYLLLFWLADMKLLCRSVEFLGIPLSRRYSGSRHRDYEMTAPVATAEAQLLTEKEQLYRVVLNFVDGGRNALPRSKDSKNFKESRKRADLDQPRALSGSLV